MSWGYKKLIILCFIIITTNTTTIASISTNITTSTITTKINKNLINNKKQRLIPANINQDLYMVQWCSVCISNDNCINLDSLNFLNDRPWMSSTCGGPAGDPMGPKKSWVWHFLGSICLKKNLGLNKVWVWKFLGSEKFWCNFFFGQTKINFAGKNLGPKKY